jgi:hypothetical protein
MAETFVQLKSTQVLKAWDTKLRNEARVNDIFGFAPEDGGIVRTGAKTLPDNSFIAKKVAEDGKSTITMSLIRDLTGSGQTGSGAKALVGKSEQMLTKQFVAHADELAHAVPHEAFGKAAFERKPYDFYTAAVQGLGLWNRKQRGVRIRQSLSEGKDLILTGSTNQNGLTSAANYPHSNIFVMGVAAASQPAFSATIGTYAGNVYAAAAAIADPTLDRLDVLSEYLSVVRPVKGVRMNGSKEMWIVTVPTRAMTILRGILRTLIAQTDNIKALGVTGAIEYGNLILVEDTRAPRVTIVDDTSFTHSYYGVTDARAATGAGVSDVGYVLGAGAVLEYELEKLHFQNEIQQFDRVKEIGTFVTCGFNRMDWDDDLGTIADARKNYSSAQILWKAS